MLAALMDSFVERVQSQGEEDGREQEVEDTCLQGQGEEYARERPTE